MGKRVLFRIVFPRCALYNLASVHQPVNCLAIIVDADVIIDSFCQSHQVGFVRRVVGILQRLEDRAPGVVAA